MEITGNQRVCSGSEDSKGETKYAGRVERKKDRK